MHKDTVVLWSDTVGVLQDWPRICGPVITTSHGKGTSCPSLVYQSLFSADMYSLFLLPLSKVLDFVSPKVYTVQVPGRFSFTPFTRWNLNSLGIFLASQDPIPFSPKAVPDTFSSSSNNQAF